jgi:hypothetical protein
MVRRVILLEYGTWLVKDGGAKGVGKNVKPMF